MIKLKDEEAEIEVTGSRLEEEAKMAKIEVTRSRLKEEGNGGNRRGLVRCSDIWLPNIDGLFTPLV